MCVNDYLFWSAHLNRLRTNKLVFYKRVHYKKLAKFKLNYCTSCDCCRSTHSTALCVLQQHFLSNYLVVIQYSTKAFICSLCRGGENFNSISWCRRAALKPYPKRRGDAKTKSTQVLKPVRKFRPFVHVHQNTLCSFIGVFIKKVPLKGLTPCEGVD